ncbi:MAG: hypothetical protein IKS97_07200 [Fibrobacter sp.]|nr:hypothetical protein [Fibrobacter sp.]
MEFAEMKKIFILSFVAIATLWAETKIETIVRIENFPENLFIDIDDMDEKDYEACSVFYEKKVRNDAGGIGCGVAGLCRSMLDSNVLLGWTEGNKGFFGGWGAIEFYVLTGTLHALRDVIEDEFIHYGICYLFTKNDSVFNFKFAKMDSILIPMVEKNIQMQKKHDVVFRIVYDYGQARVIDGPTGQILDFYDYAEDSVKARNAAISSIAPAKYKLETIRVQNRRLTASPKLLGREFTLFDVNGHELRCGTLQNNTQLPAYPTVIKIQGFGTRLLK